VSRPGRDTPHFAAADTLPRSGQADQGPVRRPASQPCTPLLTHHFAAWARRPSTTPRAASRTSSSDRASPSARTHRAAAARLCALRVCASGGSGPITTLLAPSLGAVVAVAQACGRSWRRGSRAQRASPHTSAASIKRGRARRAADGLISTGRARAQHALWATNKAEQGRSVVEGVFR